MQRNQTVDIFRLFAILAVISLHTHPFMNWEGLGILSVFLDHIARFAVPFFFVISGYYWGVKVRENENIGNHSIKTIYRLTLIYFVWCLVYILPFNGVVSLDYGIQDIFSHIASEVGEIISNPLFSLLNGTALHLWFLPSLICALLLSAIMIRFNLIRSLIVVSVTLYVLGVLAKSYSVTEVGFEINFNTRNGPFFSTAFFVAGYILSGKKIDNQWVKYGALLTFCGLICHMSENYYLWK